MWPHITSSHFTLYALYVSLCIVYVICHSIFMGLRMNFVLILWYFKGWYRIYMVGFLSNIKYLHSPWNSFSYVCLYFYDLIHLICGQYTSFKYFTFYCWDVMWCWWYCWMKKVDFIYNESTKGGSYSKFWSLQMWNW